MSDPIVRVFTDGGSRKNGSGAWAAYIERPHNVLLFSGSAQKTTSMRMELTAILKALQSLQNYTQAVEIYTDSMVVANGINEWSADWRELDDNGEEKWLTTQESPVANQDLWKAIFKLLDSMPQVTVVWVKRDSVEGNALVDAAVNHVRQLAENLRERNGR